MAQGEHRAVGRLLTCRVGRKVCALPLEQVLETMRPLPVEALPGVPAFVRGLSLIRGWPTPVIDARTLLGSDDQVAARRYVTLRFASHERRVAALAVDAVLDVVQLAPSSLGELPELLRAAQGELVTALGSLDRELLVVLQHGRLVPDELWQRLEAGGRARATRSARETWSCFSAPWKRVSACASTTIA
jgi:purine-binding chemotaxis protein CheW